MRTAGHANAVCARSTWCATVCAFGLAHISMAKALCFHTDEEPRVVGNIIQSLNAITKWNMFSQLINMFYRCLNDINIHV